MSFAMKSRKSDSSFGEITCGVYGEHSSVVKFAETEARLPVRKYSPEVKLSPVSFENVAHLALAGVSLEDFWPSNIKGSLVYSLKTLAPRSVDSGPTFTPLPKRSTIRTSEPRSDMTSALDNSIEAPYSI